MDRLLQYLGWRESPGSSRLFASKQAVVLAVVIVALTAGAYRLLGMI